MISVIMPTYNRADLIDKSIMSVLQQTYKDIELIIVDDGSTDNTKEIVSGIRDARCKYFYQENKGACAARNYGIDLAQGEYIAFQDSDDTWREDKLEKQLEVLQNNDYDLVFCAFLRHEHKTESQIPNEFFDIQTLDVKTLLKGNMISTQTILAKSKCFKEVKFDVHMPRFQDWELMLRMVQVYKIGYCKDVLADVYVQENSISMNYDKAYTAIKRIYRLHQQVINSDSALKECCLGIIDSYKRKKELDKLSRDELMQKIIDLENEKQAIYNLSLWKIKEPVRRMINIGNDRKDRVIGMLNTLFSKNVKGG